MVAYRELAFAAALVASATREARGVWAYQGTELARTESGYVVLIATGPGQHVPGFRRRSCAHQKTWSFVVLSLKLQKSVPMTLHTRSSEAMVYRLGRACAGEGGGMDETACSVGASAGKTEFRNLVALAAAGGPKRGGDSTGDSSTQPSTPKWHRQVALVMRALVLSPRALHAARRSCPAALRCRGSPAAEPARVCRNACSHSSRRCVSQALPRSFGAPRPPAGEPTIYALSTAAGRAAIAVIRVSGPACTRV
jgi:hypothetical protein